MEYYDMSYIQSRVKFMVRLNKIEEAEALVENEIDYVVYCCKEGKPDIGYYFYKTFNKYMSPKSIHKLSNAIYKSGNEKVILAFNKLLNEGNSFNTL